MRHEHEGMVALVEPEQRRMGHRRAVDVDGPVGQLLHLLGQFGLALVGGQVAQVDHRQREIHRLRNRLDRLSADRIGAHAGAQRGLATDDLAQHRFEARRVELAQQPLRRRRVVDRAAGVQLFHEADALLRRRHRRGRAVGAVRQRHALADTCALQRLDGHGQPLGGGRLEQGAQRQRDLELAAQQRGQPRGQQRMAAHGEEVVLHVQAGQAQHLLHGREHLAFAVAARAGAALHVFARHGLRRGQRGAVELAVGQGRQAGERDHVLRQHEGRQAGLQVPHQRVEVEGGAGRVGCQREVGHQPHVAGVVLARHDHAARDAGNLVAAGLDLAGLDAVAAHLHLEVESAHVLQQAVVAPAAAVAGAVQGRGVAEDARGDEALGRELRPFVVAQRHAVAADADFARHAERAGPQLGIEDPHLRVVDRMADRHAARGHHVALHVPHGRPHRGLGRAVDVPQLLAAFEQFQRQPRTHRLAADPAPEARGAGPLGVEQQLPHAGRGLQDGDVFFLEQGAQAVAVHGGLALHHHDLGAGRERQQQLGHGDVERQRGDGRDAVHRADAGLHAHRLQQVGHGAVRHAHALGLAGGA